MNGKKCGVRFCTETLIKYGHGTDVNNNTTEILKKLAVRLLMASPFFAVSFVLLFRGTGILNPFGVYATVCFAIVFMIVGAAIIAPVIGDAIGGRAVSFFFLPNTPLEKQPRYSIAESLVKKGEYEAAITRFREIADEFPDETRPWSVMMEIAAVRLHDLKRVDRFYEEALASNGKPEFRDALAQAYKAVRSLGEEKPSWHRHLPIAPPRPGHARRRS